MAIERVPYPSDPPGTNADWTLLLSLISTIALNANGNPIKVSGGNIVKGSWFQIGGTFYLATSDTSITGTSSDYVKIEPSGATATAEYVSDLDGVSWNDTYNGYYDGDDNLYVFDEGKAIYNEEITETHYNFVGVSNSGTSYLKNAASSVLFKEVGGPLQVASNNFVVSALTSNTIAVASELSGSTTLRTLQWNGVYWELIGNILTNISVVTSTVTMCSMSSTSVAWWDSSNDELRYYEFDGTDWSETGSGFSLTSSSAKITKLNSTDISIVINTGSLVLSRYTWGGSSWSLVGNSLTLGSDDIKNLTALDENTIVGNVSGSVVYLVVYEFDGTDWSKSGSNFNIIDTTGSSSGLCLLSENKIAVLTEYSGLDNTGIVMIYNYDGSTFSTDGYSSKLYLNTGGSGTPSITSFSENEIVISDTSSKSVQYFKAMERVDK